MSRTGSLSEEEKQEIDRFRGALELEQSFAFHLIVADTREVLEVALARLPEEMTTLQPRPSRRLLAKEAAKLILEELDRVIDYAQGDPVLLDAMVADRDPAWAMVFRRLNELRNGLERRHSGPLIVAVSPDGESSLGREAPDLWSRRGSGMRLTGRLRPDSANVDSESWPPPEDPAEFEWLCLDLFKELWGDPGARRGARSGQPKAGVDIFGKASNQLFGVQCKREDGLLWTRVTARDLQREVENALGFRPRLDTFILALAGPGNVIVEERAREITEEHRALGLFEVEVWSWVEIWYEISNRQELLRRILPIYWPRTSRLEAGALPESASGALALWREKLEFLLEQRAIAADIEQRFRLMKQIEEAERKIRDFDG